MKRGPPNFNATIKYTLLSCQAWAGPKRSTCRIVMLPRTAVGAGDLPPGGIGTLCSTVKVSLFSRRPCTSCYSPPLEVDWLDCQQQLFTSRFPFHFLGH